MIQKIVGIQIGASTQSQDHVMTFKSLRTIKAIVSNPQNPILAEVVLLLLLL